MVFFFLGVISKHTKKRGGERESLEGLYIRVRFYVQIGSSQGQRKVHRTRSANRLVDEPGNDMRAKELTRRPAGYYIATTGALLCDA